MVEQEKGKPTSVTVDNRKKLSVTGVDEMVGMSETLVTLTTRAGGMQAYGTNMHLVRYNAEEGVLVIEGDIDAVKYADVARAGGLFKKVFK